MNIEVGRASFFKGDYKTLRFLETYPSQPHDVGIRCGCTDTVRKKPTGEPFQINQSIKIFGECAGYQYSIYLDETRIWVRLVWDEVPLERPHAYFIFDHSNSMRVEIDKLELKELLSRSIYLGSDIDSRYMYNGHSTSRILKNYSIGATDVWCYECSWGNEALALFASCPETDTWKEIFQLVKTLFVVGTFPKDILVKEVYDTVADDIVCQEKIQRVVHWTVGITDNLKKTEMYRACMQVSKAVELSLREQTDARH